MPNKAAGMTVRMTMTMRIESVYIALDSRLASMGEAGFEQGTAAAWHCMHFNSVQQKDGVLIAVSDGAG